MAVVLTRASSPWYQAPAGASGVNYSTDEVDTGLQWTDGRPVFQKTLTGTASANGQWVSTAHGISPLGDVVSIDFLLNRADGQWVQDLALDGYHKITIAVDATNFNLKTEDHADYNGRPFWATLRYVKAAGD